MTTRRIFLSTVLPCLVPSALFAGGKKRRYRLTLIFTDPAYKWSKVIEYRDDFHFFLSANGHGVSYVAGTVYPKDGVDRVSLKIGAAGDKDGVDTVAAEVKHLKLPASGKFELTPVEKGFKPCQVQVEFLK